MPLISGPRRDMQDVNYLDEPVATLHKTYPTGRSSFRLGDERQEADSFSVVR